MLDISLSRQFNMFKGFYQSYLNQQILKEKITFLYLCKISMEKNILSSRIIIRPSITFNMFKRNKSFTDARFNSFTFPWLKPSDFCIHGQFSHTWGDTGWRGGSPRSSDAWWSYPWCPGRPTRTEEVYNFINFITLFLILSGAQEVLISVRRLLRWQVI